jgi:peptidoglycan/xylan/chitin deacetylase (PgdA/CDA1 family)
MKRATAAAMNVCITIDLDNYREYHSLVAGGTPACDHSFYEDTIPRWLDLLERANVHATFFVIGKDAIVPAHRPFIRAIAERGHEVGNHSFSHPYNFRRLSNAEKLSEIDDAGAAIADVTGEHPVGFRVPSSDVDLDTLRLLAERGYLYESSVFPSPLMWAFMLYGKLFVRRGDYQLGEAAAVLAPRQPYFPSSNHIHRRARPAEPSLPILEIPVSVVPLARVPFYSTLLRRLGTRFFSLLLHAYGTDQRVLNAIFHLIELSDVDGTPLGAAYRRMPGLSVAMPIRERFLEHAISSLASAGQAVPLREVARSELAEASPQTGSRPS